MIKDIVDYDVPDETVVSPQASKKSKKKKNGAKKVVIAIVVVAILAGAAYAAYRFAPKSEYVDMTGLTASQVAENAGMTFEDFKDEYDMPDSVKPTTSEAEAFYSIPCSKIAEMYGLTFDELKAKYQWDDTITPETSWGEAEGSTTVGVYLNGASSIEAFRAYYGFDESVTEDTLWKDVRKVVDERKRQDKEIQAAE